MSDDVYKVVTSLDMLRVQSRFTGWDQESMIVLACRFIDDQGMFKKFQDFLQEQADEESEMGSAMDEGEYEEDEYEEDESSRF